MTPTVQMVAIARADGGVSIMHFVTNGRLNSAGDVFEREATDEAIEAEIRKSGIDAASWRRIGREDIPPDRVFRDAWKDTGKIEIDMPKAREIHRERLRVLRKPLIEQLDIQYQRADERGDVAAKKIIAAKKQALRDATIDPSIDAANDPAQLAAAVPDALR